jgi:hypothetical protein
MFNGSCESSNLSSSHDKISCARILFSGVGTKELDFGEEVVRSSLGLEERSCRDDDVSCRPVVEYKQL